MPEHSHGGPSLGADFLAAMSPQPAAPPAPSVPSPAAAMGIDRPAGMSDEQATIALAGLAAPASRPGAYPPRQR